MPIALCSSLVCLVTCAVVLHTSFLASEQTFLWPLFYFIHNVFDVAVPISSRYPDFLYFVSIFVVICSMVPQHSFPLFFFVSIQLTLSITQYKHFLYIFDQFHSNYLSWNLLY
jgi:hypothetical protein